MITLPPETSITPPSSDSDAPDVGLVDVPVPLVEAASAYHYTTAVRAGDARNEGRHKPYAITIRVGTAVKTLILSYDTMFTHTPEKTPGLVFRFQLTFIHARQLVGVRACEMGSTSWQPNVVPCCHAYLLRGRGGGGSLPRHYQVVSHFFCRLVDVSAYVFIPRIFFSY